MSASSSVAVLPAPSDRHPPRVSAVGSFRLSPAAHQRRRIVPIVSHRASAPSDRSDRSPPRISAVG
eukprot:5228686-Pyramimonas_sp.AAC.1